jgi:hypothetical protein
VVHPEHGDEDRAGRVGTPHDREDGEAVTDGRVDADADTERAEEDHRYQTITQHTGGSVSVDAGFRHEVEEEVDGGRAEQADPVDVGELRFPRLSLVSVFT